MPGLIYVHDPMCSWCWAFRPALATLRERLPKALEFTSLLGGLAPDSEAAMPETLRTTLQATWRRIQQRVPGTEFNHAFWTNCQPRRSTWPACRAVIAAARFDRADAMTLGIQQAYYLQARNPSDEDTLIDIATSLGIDRDAFAERLRAAATASELQRQIERTHALGVGSFPALVLDLDGSRWPIPVDYTRPEAMLDTIAELRRFGEE